MTPLTLTATLNNLVFGHTVEWRPNTCGRLYPGTCEPSILLPETERQAFAGVFRFFRILPRDELAAFDLVEGMSRKGFTFSLIREPGSSIWLGGFGYHGNGIYFSEGESPAEAICAGILLALGGVR